jgi:hypothetical protein
MATLPRATTTVSDTAGAVASGLDTICVLSPVATSDDITPRLFGNAAAIYDQHGYSEGLEYAALHFLKTRKPVMFLGLPIATPGTVGRHDTSGNSDSCVTTVTAGGSGVLAEHDGVLTVVTGGTIGTDQIVLDLSLDGGVHTKRVRLGTASSYTVPYFGVTISFAAGDLTEGETIHTWHGTAPLSDATGWAAARAALAAQQKGFRSMLLVGDLQDSGEADDYLEQLNLYETANERFVYGRASVIDRIPEASLSDVSHSMTGAPSLTFDATAETVTRAAGSWISDGFVVGDRVTISGAAAGNNGTFTIATLDALEMGLGAGDVDTDETVATAVVVGHPGLTFTNAGDTIARNTGNWFDDGFRAGMSVTIDGTNAATNDGTFVIDTLTSVLMTLASGGVDANENIGTNLVTITAGQTKAAWMAAIDAEFATVDDAFRIDLSAGRGRILSPFSGYALRLPAGWYASIREYQHDLHIATWRKDDGPVGADLFENDVLVELDDRVDGGIGSAARFTTLRTWANGPQGAFVTLSLTRGNEGSLLSLTHNVAVVNLACTVTQLNTENIIGRNLVLNDDGTATTDSLNTIQSEVNAALELALLQNRGEGPRASKAVWTPSADDILNVPEALLTGVLDLNLSGTVHSVTTTVRVRSGGQ